MKAKRAGIGFRRVRKSDCNLRSGVSFFLLAFAFGLEFGVLLRSQNGLGLFHVFCFTFLGAPFLVMLGH